MATKRNDGKSNGAGDRRGRNVNLHRAPKIPNDRVKRVWKVKDTKKEPLSMITVKPEDRGKEFAREIGASGVDARAAIQERKNGVTTEEVKSVNPSIPIQVFMPQSSLTDLVLGVVLQAIQRGYLSAPSSNSYAAFVYLYGACLSALQGTVPQLSSAPVWFWVLMNLLLPKGTRFKTGNVNYTWDLSAISGQPVPLSTFIYGTAKVILGYTDTTVMTNMFPSVTPFSAPTESQQNDAIQSLFTFYTQTGFCLLVPAGHPSVPAWTSKDVSAFAMVYDEYETTLCFSNIATAYNEVKIRCPLLALLAPYQGTTGGLHWRASKELHRVAGCPGYIIPRLTEFAHGSQVKNKQHPILKCIDFWEFFEVLSMILGSALELGTVPPNGESFVPLQPCPLSAQQVMILLRQTMINTFDNAMLHDWQPFSGLGESGVIPYTTFSVGSNGYANAQNVGNMLLPEFFVENIRACRRLSIPLGKGSVIDFLSVLAQPTFLEGGANPGNQNRLGGYTYYDSLLLADTPVYTPAAGELPVNIVDGSFGGVTPTGYIDFNCQQYTTLLNTWNQWIQSLSSYLTTLCSVGNEPGCRALTTLIHTCQATQINQNANILKKDKSIKKIVYQGYKGDPFSKKDVLPLPASTYYQGVTVTNYTSNAKPLATLWKYAKLFILPVNPSVGGVYAGYPPFFQVGMTEPFKIPTQANFIGDLSDNPVSITMYSRHLEMAKMDVKSVLSSQSEFSSDFEALRKEGNGGFFASIAGAIANTFVPGSGEVVDRIATDIGF
jgi:hypothetical protein